MIELARWAADGPSSRFDLGFLFFPREELPPSESPLPASSTAAGLVDEAELVDRARADRQHAPGRLPRQPQRDGSTSTARARTPRGRGLGVNAIDELASTGLAPLAAARAARRRGRRARLPRGARASTRIEGGIAENVDPRPRRASSSTSATRPAARATRPRRGCASSSPRRRARDHSPTRRRRASALDTPLVAAAARSRRLRGRAEAGVDAGRASSRSEGLDAVNLGPGATRYAHTRDEQVAIAELERDVRGAAALPRR